MRAVGIVRQSRGRDESLSPAEQRERIAAVCERENLELLAVHEEIDVSGFKTAYADRRGLTAAVDAVDAGEAQVVVVGYFDRLFRNISVQGEFVSRIEDAGGRILTADMGAISAATPAQWISSTMLGVVSEYYARSVRERSGEGQRMAVAAGRIVYEKGPPGYVVEDGHLIPGPEAAVITEAFRRRAEGATVAEVRALLAEHGIARSFSSVQRMLGNRTYLGELRFGKLENLGAHEPLIDRATFDAVQRVRETRGTRPKSDRLLARLGVLRCGSCGSRMVVGFRTAGEVKGRPRYDFYRCPPVGDCTRRVTIGAEKVEQAIVDRLKVVLADAEGRASAEQGAVEAAAAAERAQADLDAALHAFGGLEDELAAVERLGELRAVRDEAVQRAHQLGGLVHAVRLTGADVDRLTLAELRDLIRGTFAAVTVAPGRGRDRLTFLLAEDAASGA